MTPEVVLALFLAWGAGIDLYLTLLLIGIAGRTEWLQLPASLSPVSSDWMLGITAVLFLVEFVIDKIPHFDSSWDSWHTFIRVPAGAALALAATLPTDGVMLPAAAALAGGTISLGAHGAKAAVRLALNTTPEPFTNWFVSLLEDLLLIGGYAMLADHPRLALGLIAVTTLAAWFILWALKDIFWRLLRLPRPDELRRQTWSPRLHRQ